MRRIHTKSSENQNQGERALGKLRAKKMFDCF